MNYNESLAAMVNSPKEAIKIIADHMLKVRPRASVTYHPYKKNEIYYDQHLYLRNVDLKKLYPEAKKGNVVYIGTVIEACVESDAKLNFEGNAKVIYHGEVIFDSERDRDADGKNRCPLHLEKGENPVTFMVRCESDDSFEFKFMPSVRWYWTWAKYYILSARATSPIAEYKGEDGVGISRLYEREADFDGEYVFPKVENYENTIDFDKICDEKCGSVAYALTYALEDTVLDVKSECVCKLYVDHEEKTAPLTLKKGEQVLIRLQRGEKFAFDFEGEHIGIPFLHSNRTSGDRFLTLGTFDDSSESIDVQFKKPYVGVGGLPVFWKLAGKDDYVRPHLLSRFFGQWHYSFMVGEYGLMNAASMLDDQEYFDYFRDHMRLMVEYFDYMRYENKHFSAPSFLDISASLHDLDSIGSIGRNLCVYYQLTGDEDALPIIDTMLKAMETKIPRFPDGTFHRHSDMWADDTFMSCPFLVQAGIMKQDNRYHEETARQLLGFKKRLWMAEEKIFSHIFFLNPPEPNNIPWGRGNGWIYVSLSDALEHISPETEGYDELMQTYREFTEGIVALQDGDGLWHQVLNRHDSYSETSCTAMFILGLSRGIRLGWIGEAYKENVRRAYGGLLSHKIDKNGAVYDVCMGSGNARDVSYYMNLGAIDNDDHGTGVVLTAICEMIRLFK
ncbi:MAG: glycoside hydrolase family 88 protein [Clostridia bacterium]|nr:glycoside hydrolase family 88 protein [Clostridia bacterium]